MLSVDAKTAGGIAEFIETLKSHLTNCEVTQISAGSVPGESALAVLLRLVTVPAKVLWLGLFRHYDVVHVNTSLVPKAAIRDALILLALRASGQRTVLLYIHGWFWSLARSIEQSGVLRRLCVFLLRGASRILVLAPEFKTLLCGMGLDGDSIRVTKTMFDGDLLPRVNVSLPRRRTILFMSRFDRPKGVYELTAGFAEIAGRYDDVDLVLAGDGEEADGLRKLVAELGIKDRVTFPGYVRGAEKGTLLNDCTIYALPSHYGEGMPVALLEALGAGKPVLTTKVGGIPSVVRDREHGVLLETATAVSIAEALDWMLCNHDWREQVGAANRRYAWRCFEAKHVTAEVEEIYRGMVKPARA